MLPWRSAKTRTDELTGIVGGDDAENDTHNGFDRDGRRLCRHAVDSVWGREHQGRVCGVRRGPAPVPGYADRCLLVRNRRAWHREREETQEVTSEPLQEKSYQPSAVSFQPKQK